MSQRLMSQRLMPQRLMSQRLMSQRPMSQYTSTRVMLSLLHIATMSVRIRRSHHEGIRYHNAILSLKLLLCVSSHHSSSLTNYNIPLLLLEASLLPQLIPSSHHCPRPPVLIHPCLLLWWRAILQAWWLGGGVSALGDHASSYLSLRRQLLREKEKKQ